MPIKPSSFTLGQMTTLDSYKGDINHKRRLLYKRSVKKQSFSVRCLINYWLLKYLVHIITQDSKDVKLSEKAPDPLAGWMELGERVRKRLDKITMGSASEFADSLCEQLLRDDDKDRVLAFSTKLGELRRLVYQYQHEVLQLAGYGENYQTLENIVKEIRIVSEWVDELLVLAMVDIGEVRRLYDASELLYQKK